MCTAISFRGCRAVFGRTLDLEHAYDEAVVITPRSHPLFYRRLPTQYSHFAIMGIATVIDGYPLYYDAVNEHGLYMAGLNFTHSAVYHSPEEGKNNLAQFELLPWILGSCRTVEEARAELKHVNLTADAFREELPPARLHWMLSDRTQTVTAEPMQKGLQIHDNPVGVLTNEPPFPMQIELLSRYRGLSPWDGESTFAQSLPLPAKSRGMGAIGLPGDLSSPSRFVRTAYVKCNSVIPHTPEETVTQCFRILGAAEQVEGSVRLNGGMVRTQYTACCDADAQTYYFTTYENHQISVVFMNEQSKNGKELLSFPLIHQEQFHLLNEKRI